MTSALDNPAYAACHSQCIDVANEKAASDPASKGFDYYFTECVDLDPPAGKGCSSIPLPRTETSTLAVTTCNTDCAVWAAKQAADEQWNPMFWGQRQEREDSYRVQCQIENCGGVLSSGKETAPSTTTSGVGKWVLIGGVAVVGFWLLKGKRKAR